MFLDLPRLHSSRGIFLGRVAPRDAMVYDRPYRMEEKKEMEGFSCPHAPTV